MLRKYPDGHQDRTSGPLTNLLIGEPNVKVLLMPGFLSIRCCSKNYHVRIVFDYCFKRKMIQIMKIDIYLIEEININIKINFFLG
jgi:hypothetical protein